MKRNLKNYSSQTSHYLYTFQQCPYTGFLAVEYQQKSAQTDTAPWMDSLILPLMDFDSFISKMADLKSKVTTKLTR